MANFTDPRWNFLKRSLSRVEKATLLSTEGRALILPGEPADNRDEVDELVAAGWDEAKIVLVERDADTAEAVYDHYFDRVGGIHWIDVHEFLANAVRQYAYIHLDYCGHIKREEFFGMQHWCGKLAPTARIRVSTMMNRKVGNTQSFERMLNEQVVQQLCEVAQRHDAWNPERWIYLRQDFSERPLDTTQLIPVVMLFNFTFGIKTYDWSDRCAVGESVLPELAGTHRLTNIRRFRYSDDPRSTMYTVWADLVPMALPSPNQRSAPDTILTEVFNVFDAVNHPCPPFNPELQEET